MGDRIYIGIDPGISGAAAAVRFGDYGDMAVESVHPLEVWKLPVGKVLRSDLFAMWLREVIATNLLRKVVIERAQAIPNWSRGSSFSFGRGFGAIEATVLATTVGTDIGMEWVQARRWKQAFRLNSNKRASLDYATMKFGPGARDRWWKTLSRNGSAEAALIAAWYAEKRT